MRRSRSGQPLLIEHVDRVRVPHVTIDPFERARRVGDHHLHPAARAEHREPARRRVVEEARLRRVAFRRGVRGAGKVGKVVAAREDDQGEVHRVDELGRIAQEVRDRDGREARAVEQRRPLLVQRVAALAAVGKILDPLREPHARSGHRQRTAMIVRLAQSRRITVAGSRSRYRSSPTPIAAGIPSSAARTAMCEFAPPYMVIKPPMSLARSQS